MLDPRIMKDDIFAYAVEREGNHVTDLLTLYNLPNFATDRNVPNILPAEK